MTCYHTQGTDIVHATAKTPIGPFTFSDVALAAETNNPHVDINERGEWILFHTNDNKPNADIATCTGQPGSSPFRGKSEPCVGCTNQGSIAVATAMSPHGPWTTRFPIQHLYPQGSSSIANPTPLVLRNGSVMLAYRYSHGVVHGQSEAIAIAVADDAAGPYHVINPDAVTLNVEDPVLYQTPQGLHLALHQYNSTYEYSNGTVIRNLQYGDPRMASGAHAFSKDGITWLTSPYALYNNTIQFANGTVRDFNYRERPEVLMDGNGNPKWLVTGVEWGLKCSYPSCDPRKSCQSVSIITEILGSDREVVV